MMVAETIESPASGETPQLRHSRTLPVPLTRLIGRERELRLVCDELRQDDVRLVTLTGPGGVGKTQLALQIAHEVNAAHPGAVRFVALAAIGEPGLVPGALASALDARGASGSIMDDLRQELQDQSVLLIVDSVEHVIDAAPLLSDLLAACPHLKILATSRERLRIHGEREVAVSTLPVPARGALLTPDAVLRCGAVQLFVACARAVAPGFVVHEENAAAVAEICRRLDGLPLAIELAASRVKVLHPAALLGRLEQRLPLLIGGARDAPARHRTMHDAIAWSYDLLSPAEQRLLQRVAVFAGGFALTAAEGVAGDDGGTATKARTLDLIESLVDKSLLWQESATDHELGPRFGMLATVREFALNRLVASGEEPTLRQRHAAWYVALTESAEAKAFGAESERFLRLLEAEHDNLRAALAWTIERGAAEAEAALQLACALWLFWFHGCHFNEGCQWFERALTHGDSVPPALRGKAMLGMGGLIQGQGNLAEATKLGEECLALYRALDDQLGMARSLHLLGSTALQNGELDRAARCLEQAVAGYRAAEGVGPWTTMATAALGVAAFSLGQRDRAAALLDEAAAMQQQVGAAWPPVFTLPCLADLTGDAAAGVEKADAPMTAAAAAAPLSSREREVLHLIAAGRSNQEIADALFISRRTASTHAANILSKLDLGSRAEVIAYAHRHGLA